VAFNAIEGRLEIRRIQKRQPATGGRDLVKTRMRTFHFLA
jgi:hypothetical protein